MTTVTPWIAGIALLLLALPLGFVLGKAVFIILYGRDEELDLQKEVAALKRQLREHGIEPCSSQPASTPRPGRPRLRLITSNVRNSVQRGK